MANSANGLRKVLHAMMRHAIEIGWRSDDPTRDVKSPYKRTAIIAGPMMKLPSLKTATPLEREPGLRCPFALHRTAQIGRGAHGAGAPRHTQRRDKGAANEDRHRFEHSNSLRPGGDSRRHAIGNILNDAIRQAVYLGRLRQLVECDKAGFATVVRSGLSKAAARRLAEAGCTAHEIAVTGHASLSERYNATRKRPIRRGSRSRQWTRCKPHWLIAVLISQKNDAKSKSKNSIGSSGWDRTSDISINSRTLYR